MSKTQQPVHSAIAAYFVNSPCRVCGVDKSYFNLIVKAYMVIGRRCQVCGHREVCRKQFPCGLVDMTRKGGQ